ncbi:Modification methylase MwoI [uncultured archaeon]|nr:Modification methylase MwoI [uncultured archaeon]
MLPDAYFKNGDFTLYNADCVETLSRLPEESVDLIFADPPYFLSNGGITCKAGKMVSVNKAEWDKSQGLGKDFDFTTNWLSGCKKVLKKNGSIWISGTMHNIYQVGFALQLLDYKILNEISWYKPNAPPNLSCRYFAHSHETLIWAKKGKEAQHTFNYQEMKEWPDKLSPQGKQMKSVWLIPLTPPSEKIFGKHPTQKPLELLRRIITSSSNKENTVLDPFNGSGTTGVVAKELGRKYIGIDLEKKFLDLAIRRAGFNKENLLATRLVPANSPKVQA